MIGRIIKAEVCVLCRSRRLRRITQAKAFSVNSARLHAKTESNNCFTLHLLAVSVCKAECTEENKQSTTHQLIDNFIFKPTTFSSLKTF